MDKEYLSALTAIIREKRKELEELAVSGTLDGTRAVSCEGLFPEWTAGPHTAGEVKRYGGQLWKCVQSHDSTGQTGWEPGNVPALWTPYHTTDPAFAKPFIQPTMTEDSYFKGEVCIWTDGMIYRSIMETANAYSPADYPAGWEVVQ